MERLILDRVTFDFIVEKFVKKYINPLFYDTLTPIMSISDLEGLEHHRTHYRPSSHRIIFKCEKQPHPNFAYSSIYYSN